MKTDIMREHLALSKEKHKLLKTISAIPSGYISKKQIHGKTYAYLQVRCNRKVTSKYIPKEHVNDVQKRLSTKKLLKMKLGEIDNRLKQLEQAAALIDQAVLRKMLLLRLSAGMEGLSSEKKEHCIVFSHAMNDMEGCPVSPSLRKNLAQWKDGSKSYLSVYTATLKQYGFQKEGVS